MEKKNGRQRSEHEAVFSDFLKHLEEWSQSGIVPPEADKETRRAMNAESERLKKLGIRKELSIEPNGPIEPMRKAWGDTRSSLQKETDQGEEERNTLNRDVPITYYQHIDRTIRYIQDERVLYQEKKALEIYQSIRGLDSTEWESDVAVPETSDEDSPKAAKNRGCKVSNYYYMNDACQPDRELARLPVWSKISALLGGLSGGLAATIRSKDLPLPEQVGMVTVSAVIAGAVFFVLGYIICLLFAFVKLYIADGGNREKLSTVGSKRITSIVLSGYDPLLSYEYFEEKALSLLKGVLFEEPRSKENSEDARRRKEISTTSSLKWLVASDYRGTMSLRFAEEKNGLLCVGLRIFLTNTYFIKGRLYRKNEEAIMMLCRNAEWEIKEFLLE